MWRGHICKIFAALSLPGNLLSRQSSVIAKIGNQEIMRCNWVASSLRFSMIMRNVVTTHKMPYRVGKASCVLHLYDFHLSL
jgi:hypothetical protein